VVVPSGRHIDPKSHPCPKFGAGRFDDYGVTTVFPGEPEQMTAGGTGCISRRVRWLDLDAGATDRAKVGAPFGRSGRDHRLDLHSERETREFDGATCHRCELPLDPEEGTCPNDRCLFHFGFQDEVIVEDYPSEEELRSIEEIRARLESEA